MGLEHSHTINYQVQAVLGEVMVTWVTDAGLNVMAVALALVSAEIMDFAVGRDFLTKAVTERMEHQIDMNACNILQVE